MNLEPFIALLLASYICTLICSLLTQKSLLRNEIKFWAWYLIVGLMAGLYAHDVFLTRRYPVPDGIDINLNGMFRVLTYDFVIPFIKGFAVLSAVRFFILLIALRKRD